MTSRWIRREWYLRFLKHHKNNYVPVTEKAWWMSCIQSCIKYVQLSLTLIIDEYVYVRDLFCINVLNINIIYFHNKIFLLQIHYHLKKLFTLKKYLQKLKGKKNLQVRTVLDHLVWALEVFQFLNPVLTKNY